MTNYDVSVQDILQRRVEIAAKANASKDTRPFFEYSETERLSVVRLSLKTPVYNMRNYRTQTRQRAYIHRNNLPSAFFLSGQEDESAQGVQHAILWELAQRGVGDSIIPVATALAEDGRQTEPLLVTSDAVVVNGNRRLAAFRELYESDPGRYDRFTTIEALVLPSGVTLDDLKRIEFRLQMRPQTLLPYEWVDEALAVRDLRDSNFSDAEIAVLKRMSNQPEVQVIADRLSEAEIYLTDYLNQADDYERVYEHEQQFSDLQKALRQKRSVVEKECSRRICHVMTKHSREFGTRIYDYKGAFGAKASEVMERLALRRDIKLQDIVSQDDPDDLFGGAEPDPAQKFIPLQHLLLDSERSDSLARDIKEIFDEIREEEREQDINTKALKAAQRANTLVHEIHLGQADPSTYPAIEAQLSAVVGRASALIKDIQLRQLSGDDTNR